MSRYYGVIATEIQNILRSTQSMTTPEIETTYGVTISEDGSIHDPTYSMNFNNLSEWATFCVEQDFEEYDEQFSEFGGWS